jgi:hypothetical protein
MTDKDKSTTTPNETVVEHPQLKRDRALPSFLSRSRARQHGKPLPDPSAVGPAAFTRLTRDMSHEEMVENLIATFERIGIKVKRGAEQSTNQDGPDDND